MSSAASVNYICITDLVYNSLTLHSQVEVNWKMDIINPAAEFIQKNSSKKHEIVLRKCIKTFLKSTKEHSLISKVNKLSTESGQTLFCV